MNLAIVTNHKKISQLVEDNNRYPKLTNNNELTNYPNPLTFYENNKNEKCEREHEPLPLPSPGSIIGLREKYPILFEGEVHKDAKSLHDINFLLIPDYLENWKVLPLGVKEAFIAVTGGNWSGGNWNEKGIKRKSSDHPLIDHLLFNIGCEVWNKVPRETDVINSCLKGGLDYYHSKTSSRRYINPNAAAKEIAHRESLYRPDLLYKGMNSISILFETDEQLADPHSSLFEMKEAYRNYFHRNLTALKKITGVQSYVLSHEISLTSIRRSEFKPHSHAIIWFLKGEGLEFLEKPRGAGILKYRPEDLNTTWAGEKGMWEYIVKTQNLADVYRREWSEVGVRDFNFKSKEALGRFIELHYGEIAQVTNKQGKKMIYWDHIPSTTTITRGRYRHIPLEKYQKKLNKRNIC
jgi:hypothetical protein